MKRFNLFKPIHTVLVSIIVFFVSTSFFWIIQNDGPPRWDESWYLEVSEILFQKLTVNGPVHATRYLSGALQVKAPLIAALPIPVYLVFGRGLTSALSANMLAMGVFFIFLFLMAQELFKKKDLGGLAAVFVAATMPYLFGVYRVFLVEGGLTTIVTIFLFLLIKSDRLKIPKYVIWLGIVAGFGMLMKITFPIYVIGPVLMVFCLAIREEGFASRSLWKHVLWIVLICGLIASIWYVKNIKHILGFVLYSGYSDNAANYGLGDVFSWETISAYWIMNINSNLSVYHFFLFPVLFIILVIMRRKELKAAFARNGFPLLFIGTWFFVPLTIFTLGVNKDFRFMIPALPAFALILGRMTGAVFCGNRFRAILLPLLCVFPLFSYFVLSFDIPLPERLEKLRHVRFGKFTLLTDDRNVVCHPERSWRHKEILESIAKDAERFPTNITAMMIADHRFFNYNNFRYYTHLYGYDSINFQTSAYVPKEKTMEEVVALLNQQDYLVGKTGFQGPSFTTWRNEETLRQLENGDMPFKKVGEFDLPDDTKALVFKSYGPGEKLAFYNRARPFEISGKEISDLQTGTWSVDSDDTQGISLEIQNNQLFLAWHYLADGGVPAWYAAQISMADGYRFSGNLNELRGAPLGGPQTAMIATSIGLIDILFVGKNEAVLTWAGEKRVLRKNKSESVGRPSLTFDGWWHDPAYEGMGFFIENHENTGDIIWYYYNQEKNPEWCHIIGDRALTDDTGVWTGRIKKPDKDGGILKNGEAIAIKFEGSDRFALEWDGSVYHLQRLRFNPGAYE